MLNETSDAGLANHASPPEAFTEGAVGFLLIDGKLHITLTALRPGYRSNPEPENRVVIGRAVMPFPGPDVTAVGLCSFKLHGLDFL